MLIGERHKTYLYAPYNLIAASAVPLPLDQMPFSTRGTAVYKYLNSFAVGYFIFFSAFFASNALGSVDSQELHRNWEYRKVGTSTWNSASVPGCVHTDLIADGIIEDPSYGLNEKNQQWVGYSDWEYQTTFVADESLLNKQNVRLVFKGLDTYADVYLNDELILSANNMFRTWKVDCKDQLKAGENQLRVHFHNVFTKTLPLLEKADFPLQAFTNNDQAKVKFNMYSRKAGFHFGWDWGPRLVTCGIWRPILLESYDDVLIEDVFYEQTSVNSEVAKVTAHVRLRKATAGALELSIRNSADEPIATKQVTVSDINKDLTVKIPFNVESPKLWWTHELGDQPLYKFSAEVKSNLGHVDSHATTIGIRDLKVVREKDAHGKAMRIELNGVPVFAKGANYIPQDNFQSRVTATHYEKMISAAKTANMNMLRVWGGGIYEEDRFYDLCDREGILVWQDTMFACAMYPADEAFLANVREEVIDNARRLRNHPSLALYCGNNEVEISWFEWGWRDKYNDEDRLLYETNLKKLFYETIPSALKEADPSRYYHPSSPITGYSDRPLKDGDVHYWGVWHGKEPFENFQDNVGRFMSEYGFQSYPSIETVSQYAAKEDHYLESDVMHAHQRSMADEGRDVDYGNRLINDYLDRYFPQPRNFESHLKVTQLVQAYGVKTAIESHRRKKPFCMGTLYWQINDCWPVASWSSIDYYGRWKALHYEVKRAYAETIISSQQNEDSVDIYLCSDRVGEDINTALNLKLVNFYGDVSWEENLGVTLSGAEGKLVATVDLNDLPELPLDSHFLSIDLVEGDQQLATKMHYFVLPKELKIQDPVIYHSIEKVPTGYQISLSSKQFVSYAHLEVQDAEAKFSDNYFDMYPGKNYEILITTSQIYDDPNSAISVQSLYDLTQPAHEEQALRPSNEPTEAVNR